MLDTWCFSTFRLRMPHMCSIGFRSGDILGHSITFTFSFISKAVSWRCVFGVVIMLENCRSPQFLKGGHHFLLQNVTVHVGIYFSLNEPQLSCTSSSHTAPDHDATTTIMLDCKARHNFLGIPHQSVTTHAGHHLSQIRPLWRFSTAWYGTVRHGSVRYGSVRVGLHFHCSLVPL